MTADGTRPPRDTKRINSSVRDHAVSSLQDAAESVGQSLPERDLAEATRLHRNTITNIETGKYAGDETSLSMNCWRRATRSGCFACSGSSPDTRFDGPLKVGERAHLEFVVQKLHTLRAGMPAGIKAQFGRVPVWPTSATPTLAHVGPIARNVTDAALMLTAIGGYDPRDPFSVSAAMPDLLGACRASVADLRIAYRQTKIGQRSFASFAALDVLEGKVIGRCMQRHRHQEFIRFLNAIESQVPARKIVHVILDNYAAHSHPKVRQWLDRHPRFIFHFTPTSCSWLNAVEGFFAKLAKRRLKRGVFKCVVDLQATIDRFVIETNNEPKLRQYRSIADRTGIGASAASRHRPNPGNDEASRNTRSLIDGIGTR